MNIDRMCKGSISLGTACGNCFRCRVEIEDIKNKEKIKLIAKINTLFEQYEEWNGDDRTDGIIYHTDCLDDFIAWMTEVYQG